MAEWNPFKINHRRDERLKYTLTQSGFGWGEFLKWITYERTNRPQFEKFMNMDMCHLDIDVHRTILQGWPVDVILSSDKSLIYNSNWQAEILLSQFRDGKLNLLLLLVNNFQRWSFTSLVWTCCLLYKTTFLFYFFRRRWQ